MNPAFSPIALSRRQAILIGGAAAMAPLSACSAQPADQVTPTPRLETRGLDPTRMAATVTAAAALPRIRSLLVLRHGETLAEHRFNGDPPLERPVNIKSASKSVMSALVGVAIAKGVLTGADQTVLSVLSADAPANPDPRLGRLTIGDLLSMRSGLQRTSGEFYGRWVSSKNWVRYVLAQPFVDEPGGRMIYSTGNTHLLSAILTHASKRSSLALAREWLGGPLEITIPPWPADPQGVYFGGNDMLLSPRALARFGELYRNDGRVVGAQVIPRDWIADSWTPRAVSPWSGNQYGYGWFIAQVGEHPVRFGWGYGGQMVYVAPSLALTVVMTSVSTAARERDHIQSLHRLLSDGIIPAAALGAT
ncbi:serine hydrolase domain-containing protein [Phenylobacterium immobile]|uniref:serine hydrolase domain-containing protein n=1 Tax=Phenylobacterium immobile TaxID=21 RepID=UPI000AF78C46|nr:serine hydrolase [Phenylobacterium immobile]